MPSYATARFVFAAMSALGWLLVAVSIGAGMFAANNSMLSFPALLGAVGGFFSGLVTVATAQIGFAQIAVARNSHRMVELLEAKGVQRAQPDRPTFGGELRREPTFRKTD